MFPVVGNTNAFTNITLDWVCPEDLREKRLKLGGEFFSYPFGELEKEMGMINKAYIEVMTAGDAKEESSPSLFPPIT